MNGTRAPPAPGRSLLAGRTARDVMTPAPESLSEWATAGQAAAFLDEHPFGAAPVTDDAGRRVGVLSRADIAGYQPGGAASRAPAPPWPVGAVVRGGTATVRANDLMSPTVFSVAPQTPAEEVAAQLVQLHIHRLFVVDRDGVLVGVVTALDLLRRVRP